MKFFIVRGAITGKLMYSSTYEHVPICAYMSYRPSIFRSQAAEEAERVRGILVEEK
jgi:hypothetical protein